MYLLESASIIPTFCCLPSYFSKLNYAEKVSASLIRITDKTDDWGHFSIGVVIADATADVTMQNFVCFKHMFMWFKGLECTCLARLTLSR